MPIACAVGKDTIIIYGGASEYSDVTGGVAWDTLTKSVKSVIQESEPVFGAYSCGESVSDDTFIGFVQGEGRTSKFV